MKPLLSWSAGLVGDGIWGSCWFVEIRFTDLEGLQAGWRVLVDGETVQLLDYLPLLIEVMTLEANAYYRVSGGDSASS
jgi:hypothetical protein